MCGVAVSDDCHHTHVVRRADGRVHHVRLGREVTAQPQIAQLDGIGCGDEHICWLDVTVHHTPLVHVAQRVSYLSEMSPDFGFGQGSFPTAR